MKWLEKQQVIIFAVAALIVVGFGLFQYYPMTQKARTIRKTIEQQQVVSAETDQFIQQMAQLRQQVEQLQPVQKDFEQKFPRSIRIAGLWQQIADVMSQHNLANQEVKREGESEDGRFGVVRIRIQGSGSYRQMFDFFRSIQKLDRFIRIDTIQLTNDNELSGQVKLDAAARVYYQVAASDSV